MDNGLIDLKNGALLINDKKVYIGMTYDDIVNTFDHIKSQSQYINKERNNCRIVCLFSCYMYDIPAEIRIFLHEDAAYKIYLSFDANDTIIDPFDSNLDQYQEKAIQTAKNLKKKVKEIYPNLTDNGYIFYVSENGYKFYSSVDNYLLECSAIIEKEK